MSDYLSEMQPKYPTLNMFTQKQMSWNSMKLSNNKYEQNGRHNEILFAKILCDVSHLNIESLQGIICRK